MIIKEIVLKDVALKKIWAKHSDFVLWMELLIRRIRKRYAEIHGKRLRKAVSRCVREGKVT